MSTTSRSHEAVIQQLCRQGVSVDELERGAEQLRQHELVSDDRDVLLARKVLWLLGSGASANVAVGLAVEEILQEGPRNSE